MSNATNIIDLTNDASDEDDNRRRDQYGFRSQTRATANPPRAGQPSQSYRDRQWPSASSASSFVPYSYQRSVPHGFGSDYNRQNSSSAPAGHRQFSNTSNSLSTREVMRTNTTTIRPSVVSTSTRFSGFVKGRPLRRACINCSEVNVTCDGERPCSACVEPGLDCYYPGEQPSRRVDFGSLRVPNQSNWPVSQHQSRGSYLSALKAASPTSRLSSGLLANTTSQSDVLANKVRSTGQSLIVQPRTNTLSEEEAFDDSDESEDDEVPLAIAEFEEVRRLLKKHEARMREHRAYLLHPLLNQAKIDAVRASQPSRPDTKINVFANITARSRSFQSTNSGKSTAFQIQTKSHKAGAHKKWNLVSIPIRIVKTDPTILPKYKSIGRLGTSLLAPNIRTLKYWPYFADEENVDPSEAKKNEELEERYQHDDNQLLAQRKCSELVDMWTPWVKEFVSKLQIEFIDILYWFLHTTEETTCHTCERQVQAEIYQDIMKVITKPTDRSLMLARLSALALKEVAKISMWHIVMGVQSVQDILKQTKLSNTIVSSLCSICFLHNCISHGAYQEPEESGGAVIMGGNIEINDDEPSHNIRLPAAVQTHGHKQEHQCGLYCVTGEARVKDILGRRKDGTVGGMHNRVVHVPRPTIKNDTTCSENCYWPVEKRTKFVAVSQTKGLELKLPEKSRQLFRKLLRIYSNNQRAPCMLARDIDQLACLDAFYYMLAETQSINHFHHVATNAMHQNTRKLSKITIGLDTTLSADLDERPPFVPCSHPGPCLNNPECTCAQSKVHCEWFCNCDKSCDRRFPGCKCASTNKLCFNEKTCECWKHNRECDPWVCGTCGVVEVLDPQNKYRDVIRIGRCKNNRIQLELPARTIKAPSEVQGWGLFAGTAIEENTFIGEYKGEIVGNQESDRRGAVYANIGQEYLFVMNRDQQIDGSNFGNKTRFINNSQRDDFINVLAKKLLCNGVQRVMLYAKKPINAGEELLYNYNYPVSVTKKFWERGEAPTHGPGAVVAKPLIAWTQPRVNGRFAKMASNEDGERPVMMRKTSTKDLAKQGVQPKADRDAKRKRASESDVLLINAKNDHLPKAGVQANILGVNGLHMPDDPDDSDYELADASESTSGSADEAEGRSEEGESSDRGQRRRVILPQDRRRGGLAQAKAWETRRRRVVKGK